MFGASGSTRLRRVARDGAQQVRGQRRHLRAEFFDERHRLDILDKRQQGNAVRALHLVPDNQQAQDHQQGGMRHETDQKARRRSQTGRHAQSRTANQRSQHGSQQSPQKFESSRWHGVGYHPRSEIRVSPYVGNSAASACT